MSARTFVLIRGLTRGRGHWGDFPDHLRKILRADTEDRIIFGELQGNGELYHETSPWSIPATAQALRQNLVTQLRPEDQNIVIAISMGAMVASSWMASEPSLFSNGFFINTSSARHSLFTDRFKPEAILLNPEFWKSKDKELETLKVTSNVPERWRAQLPVLRAYSATHPVSKANALRQIAAAATYAFPSKSPGRCVFFVSENDRLVSARCTRKIAAAWTAPIETHPSAGHDLPLDDPEWIVQMVKKHL